MTRRIMKNLNKQHVVLASVVLAIGLIASGTVFYFAKMSVRIQTEIAPPLQILPPGTANIGRPVKKVINDKYGLFMAYDSDSPIYQSPTTTKYFEDGLITTGKYTGYHRILGFLSSDEDPYSDGTTLVFATKDYSSFIVAASSTGIYGSYSDYAGNVIEDYVNKAKVIGVGEIPLNHPQMIDEGNFALVRDYVSLDWLSIPQSGAELASSVKGLMFYSDHLKNKLGSKYLSANTDVFVKDAAGLVVRYSLTSKEILARAQGASDTFRYSGISYKKEEMVSNAPLYQTYGDLFPGACGTGSAYVLQNITADDLLKIGHTLSGVDMYVPKDGTHDLNREEYDDKVNSGFTEVNGIPAPFFLDYVAKNPVLIFKDPWDRWIGIGETEYEMIGGCGKPVIYLYPPKPTEVTVKFINHVRFTTDIPTYERQWRVLAHPDGGLQDLQPQVTDCSSIPSNVFGSEYARDACARGTYPYLYWAGQAAGDYPYPQGGWVVARDNLEEFLAKKLQEMGFTRNEANDMTNYWVPEMSGKKAPYYRISFFQTREMNKFIPMQVTPRPDTVLRVFLDWTPLARKPNVEPEPQVLQHVQRKGFTLVEWGGLKR